jgi:hypothetical protein
MALRWKREEAGVYNSTNGRWSASLEEGKWNLFDLEKEKLVLEGQKKKKTCQEKAEEIEANGASTKPGKRPPPRRPGKQAPKETQVEKLEKAVEDRSMTNLLVTLYLEVSGLKFSLERVLHSVGAVESALQKIVDPEKKMNQRQ